MTIQKIKSGRVTSIDADVFVAPPGTLFFNENLGDLRLGDGVTPGGILLNFGGGGGGGNYTLPTATTSVKGGVKIDGSTITITNQVISVGTVPYNKISGTPTIPTDNSQLANSAGYITSAALTGLATQSYVTSRGYLTSVSWNDVSGKPTLFDGTYASLSGKPTLFSGSYNDLTNKPTIPSAYTLPTATDTILGGVKIGSNISINAGVISVAAPFSGSYSDLSNKPALFSGSYTDLTNKPTIPTDINQLTDASGLLGQGGGGGDYTLPTASSTVKGGVKIGSNITITDGVISVAAPFSGSYADLTNKPTLVTSYTQLTDKPTIPSITGLATETYVTTQGYITSSALTGLATETYVTTRGYLTTVDYSIITNKPALFSGSYTDLSNKPTLVTSYTQLTDRPTLFSGSYTDLTNKPALFSGSYDDLTNKPSIPSITGLATETYVTTRGYLTTVDYSIITGKPTLFSGSYDDLSNKPTIPAAQIQSDWTQTTNTALDYIKNKPTLFSGSYDDLSNKPTLVTSYNSLTDLPTLVTSYTQLTDLPTLVTSYNSLTDLPDLTGYATVTGEETLTNKTLTSPTITDGVFQDSFTIGNQVFYDHGYNGFSVNEDFDIVGENNFTGYHYTSGAGRDGVAFTLARTGQFTTGFGIHGTAENNEYVIGSETTNTDFVFKNNIGMPFNVSGGTEIFRISKTGVLTIGSGESLQTIATESYVTTQGYITSTALTGLATETYVTTQGYITSSALTGLATESFVTSRGYITGLSWDQLTNKPSLAGTYTWSIAADDSSLKQISAGESVKFLGAGGITTASDAEGNITITGAVPDRLTSNNRSAILNSNGTFSLPSLTSAPATPQAGQMALANGTSWDPIAQGNGAPYMVMYTGTAWIGLGSGSGGVTVDQVYSMIVEMG